MGSTGEPHKSHHLPLPCSTSLTCPDPAPPLPDLTCPYLTPLSLISPVLSLISPVLTRDGYRLVFIRYRYITDTFKTIPVPKRCRNRYFYKKLKKNYD